MVSRLATALLAAVSLAVGVHGLIGCGSPQRGGAKKARYAAEGSNSYAGTKHAKKSRGRRYVSAPPLDDSEQQAAFAQLGVSAQAKEGRAVLTAVADGGPAAKAGTLRVGDSIEQVAEGEGAWTLVSGKPLSDVARAVRGAAGTTVRLKLERRGADGSVERISAELERAPAPQIAAPAPPAENPRPASSAGTDPSKF